MAYLGNKPATGENNAFRILDDITSHVVSFDGSSASVVSLANDTITITDDKHRYVTGQRITYGKGGGTVITGLTDATAYYVIRDSATTIQLATSASNATNGVAVNLTGLGAGTAHTITLAFDGVNTKFKATYENGTQDPLITRAAQLVLSLNGVIQQPVDSTTPSTGFGIDHTGTIIFSTAPASTDNFWGHVLASNTVTFDISDNTIDNFTGNGSLVNFTLSKIPPDNRNILVTLDGVVQYPSDNSTTRAYTLSENELQFVSAPASGVAIQVRHIGFAGASGGGGGGVTGFYGRTGNVVLKNTDNIIANNATFSGNVSIAKTLTYMDVTNIDAVGIVTFQDDVQYNGSGAGISSVFWDKSANEFKFKDGVKLSFGDAQDLNLYHSGVNSFIDDSGTGSLYISAASDVFIRSHSTNKTMFRGTAGGEAGLYSNSNKRIETTGYGATVFGTTETQKLNVTGISTFAGASTHNEDVTFTGATSGRDVFWDKSANTLLVKDNAFLNIGSGNDLQLYHNSSNNHSYISEAGSGSLVVLADDFYIQDTSTNSMIQCIEGAQVQLHYGGTKRFETTNTGTITSGISTVTGVIDAQGYINLAQKIIHTGDADTSIEFDTNIIKFETAGAERLKIESGNITQTIDTDGEGLIITTGTADIKPMLTGISPRSAENNTIFGISGKWGANEVGRIAFEAGNDTTNKDDARIRLYTRPSGGSLTQRITISENGQFVVGTNPTVNAGNIAHIEAPSGFNNGETIVAIVGNANSAGPRLVLQNKNTGSSANSEILGTDAGGQSTGSVRFYHTDQSNNYGKIALGTRNAGGPPVDRLLIDKDGNMILGTGSPNTYSNYTTFTINGTTGGQIDVESNGTKFGDIYTQSNTFHIRNKQSSGNGDLVFHTTLAGTCSEKLRIYSTGWIKSQGTGASFEQVETNSYNSSWAAATGKIAIKGDLSGGNYFGWRQKNVAAGSVTQANAEKKLPTLNDFTYPNSSSGMLLASTSKIGFAASGESPQYSTGVTMIFDSTGLALGSSRAFDCNDTVSNATTARIKLFGNRGQIGLNLNSMSNNKTKLEVRSNTEDAPAQGLVYFKVDQDSNNPVLRIDNAAGGNSTETHGLLIKNTAAGYGLRVDADGSGGSPFIVDASGDVHIGRTTDLGGKLDVFDGRLILSKTGTGTRNWSFINNNIAAGNLGIQVSSATDNNSFQHRMEISANGQVCIGNPAINPGYRLHLINNDTTQATNGGANDVLAIVNSGTASRATANILFAPSASQPTVRIGSWASDDGSTTNARDGDFFVETKQNDVWREHFRVTNGGKIIYPTNTSQGTSYEDFWNGSHGSNVFQSVINYKHYVGFNEYTWFKYTAGGGSSSRAQWVKFKVMWSTGHASGVGYWDFSVLTRNAHGNNAATPIRCVRQDYYHHGGSYYGWSSNPEVVVYSSTTEGGSAGFYLRVRGHGNHNGGSFNMHTMQSWHILAFDNQWEGINNSKFEFVTNNSGGPSAAGSAVSWSNPQT